MNSVSCETTSPAWKIHLPQTKKKIKIAFFLTFSPVFDNILQNLTLAGSGKRAMAFTRQKYFTLTLASWRALVSIPVDDEVAEKISCSKGIFRSIFLTVIIRDNFKY